MGGMKLTTKQRNAKERVFPADLARSTPEEWRELKRQEWREVMLALETYEFGSGFTPAQAALDRLLLLARQIDQAVTAADWVAW
jgi:hypothetical protein